jgi:hypothetical protein
MTGGSRRRNGPQKERDPRLPDKEKGKSKKGESLAQALVFPFFLSL